MTDISRRRLDIADTRSFTTPGAGAIRRRALAEHAHAFLREVWRDACQGRRQDGVALAAVGSLSRIEPGPLSDWDLVLVHHPRGLSGSEVTAFADRIWYPIWDSGVKLDHSVRTVNECRQVAGADLAAASGLLDIAHIAGDQVVVDAVRTTVLHDWRKNARTRLGELADAVAHRHARHGDLAQLIEPDLKESRGGTRDMAVVRALTAAWLTDRPHGGLDESFGFLLDVRDAVHVVTGRGRDRLARDDHDAVAALLGFRDVDDLLVALASAGREIGFATDGMLRRAGQSQRARVLRVGPRRPQMTPLGHGLHLNDGEVVLGTSVQAQSDPVLPLRAALAAARNETHLAPTTLRNLATLSPDLPTPWPRLALDLFTDLLATGPGLVPVWEGLDLAGIVDSWIPQWAAIRCRPQRSAVHRHSVDRHLIEAVVGASAMRAQVSRPDLLVLAALLHDIGKVAGAHDHSREGAMIAAAVLDRMGVTAPDRDVILTLVREHLTLADLATRRDPQDPATVSALAQAVGGSAQTLDLLRVLTEADARAAGPAAWSDWRARLVESLYQRARRHLEGSEPVLEPVSEVDDLPRHALERIAMGGSAVMVEDLGGAYEVRIIAPDRAGLFCDCAALLAAHGFSVRRASITTIERIAVNTWWVETPGGDSPQSDRIERDLGRLTAGDRTPLGALSRRRAAHAGARSGAASPVTRAFVLAGASRTATVIEVRALDRPGLLQDIGSTFARAGLSVRSAHIATHAGQTLDTFYVTDQRNAPLDPARAAQIVGMLIEACETP